MSEPSIFYRGLAEHDVAIRYDHVARVIRLHFVDNEGAWCELSLCHHEAVALVLGVVEALGRRDREVN